MCSVYMPLRLLLTQVGLLPVRAYAWSRPDMTDLDILRMGATQRTAGLALVLAWNCLYLRADW